MSTRLVTGHGREGPRFRLDGPGCQDANYVNPSLTSTGRCNCGCEHIGRCVPVECVPWPHIQFTTTTSSSRCVSVVRSIPLGKHCRRSAFVFSFEPRCHGL